ncbi:MAG: YhcB family protein [Psychromonas sp.]
MVGINEILIFLVGGIIGFVICRLTLGTKQKDLESTKADLEQYKAQVTNHFNDSAKLMGEVASSYQALYKHMAGQSQTLLSDSDIETQPFPQLKTASEIKPQETQTVEEATPETAQEDVTDETVLKNDAEQTGEETVKKETTQESDQATQKKETNTETDKESTQQESSKETKEAEPKKQAAGASQTDK